MKKFPHQQFLDDNHIELESLPEMLQKRIIGFTELEEDLEHTTGEDQRSLHSRLEFLSHELEEDLEEHFEDMLENNDEQEDEVLPNHEEPSVRESIEETQGIQEAPIEETIEELILEKEPEPQQDSLPLETVEETVSSPEHELEPEASKEPSDEEILEGFLAEEKRLVLPSELRQKGFKGDLGGRTVIVGNFCLHKGKYDTCYKITIQS